MDIPIEKRFKVLCEIVRAQHFAWREAALAMAPEVDPVELGNKMWEITGVQTAKAYLKRLNPAKPLAAQVAESIAWSSVCMGEDATVETGEGDEAFVRHADCPWFHWHKRLDVLSEDQPGCDTWFFTRRRRDQQGLGHQHQDRDAVLSSGRRRLLPAAHLGRVAAQESSGPTARP